MISAARLNLRRKPMKTLQMLNTIRADEGTASRLMVVLALCGGSAASPTQPSSACSPHPAQSTTPLQSTISMTSTLLVLLGIVPHFLLSHCTLYHFTVFTNPNHAVCSTRLTFTIMMSPQRQRHVSISRPSLSQIFKSGRGAPTASP